MRRKVLKAYMKVQLPNIIKVFIIDYNNKIENTNTFAIA